MTAVIIQPPGLWRLLHLGELGDAGDSLPENCCPTARHLGTISQALEHSKKEAVPLTFRTSQVNLMESLCRNVLNEFLEPSENTRA